MKWRCLTAIAAMVGMFSLGAFGQQPPASQAALVNSPDAVFDPVQWEAIVIPGEDWTLAAGGFRSTDGPAANRRGELYFNDGRSGKTLKLGMDGKVGEFVADSHHGAGQAFGPDGRLYAVAAGIKQIIAYDANAHPAVIAQELFGNDIVVAANGAMYVTNSPARRGEIGKVWYISAKGEKKIVDPSFTFPNGLALSPDQSRLYVGDYHSHFVYRYQIEPDGSLSPKEKFCDLRAPTAAGDAADDGMRIDRDGRLYVTTRLGIQVCDPEGRLLGIMPTPGARVSNLSFGGPDFDVLYATCGETIFQRKLKVRGALSYEAPIAAAPKP